MENAFAVFTVLSYSFFNMEDKTGADEKLVPVYHLIVHSFFFSTDHSESKA